MKIFQIAIGSLLAAAFLAAPLTAVGADKKADNTGKKASKSKPYTLKTCVVSDEKFGGDMGDPFVFDYKGQEIKLCCKSCKKDFDKDPAKFIKKIEGAGKKKE